MINPANLLHAVSFIEGQLALVDEGVSVALRTLCEKSAQIRVNPWFKKISVVLGGLCGSNSFELFLLIVDYLSIFNQC